MFGIPKIEELTKTKSHHKQLLLVLHIGSDLRED
jgi:hypothetical protein